jgi:hypothetical protein
VRYSAVGVVAPEGGVKAMTIHQIPRKGGREPPEGEDQVEDLRVNAVDVPSLFECESQVLVSIFSTIYL